MRTAAVAISLALAACASSGAVSPRARPASAVSEVLLRLRRESCFGSCPAYVVTIYGDGSVRYEGQGGVCEPGPISDRLSAQQMAELRAAIVHSQFAHVSVHCCDRPCSDTPTITLTVAEPLPERTIVDFECGPQETPVQSLAIEVDRVLQVERWIGTKEQRKKCLW
jgi:hypothetical protein